MRLITAFLAMLVLGTRGVAQLPRCSNSGAAIARTCELDGPLIAKDGSPGPRYPDILRQAGVGGEARVRYVVDTVGRALVSSFEVLRSTHPLFATAVRNSVPGQRFEPPRRADVLTSVIVEELVVFVPPPPQWRSSRQDQVTRRTIDSTGYLLTTIHAFTPRDSAKAPVLSGADSIEIYEAVVEELSRNTVLKTPPAAWCVQLPGAMIERWRRNGRRVVARALCPPTYTTMVRTPDSRDPPRGWIDPVAIAADSIVSWAEEIVILTLQTSQGTVGTTQSCKVTRVAGAWKARCAMAEYRIS